MGALEGIKVIDLSSMVSGPMAACILADQGATVIKVEPLQGEQLRYLGPPVNGLSPAFFSCNRGKQSIALDLKSEEGSKILRELIKEADVLLQNFRPGAIDRMGFGEQEVRKYNANIIYVSISGFGEKGPYAHQRVYDPIIQALSGATDVQSDRITRKPAMFRIIIADKVASLTTAQAISSALFHRERRGEGQHIKISMLDSMLSFFWPEAMGGLTYADGEFDSAAYTGSTDLIYPTQDGFITISTVTDKEWSGFCTAIDRPDLFADERFATASNRTKNRTIRLELTAVEMTKWNSADILKRLKENDVPCAPLLRRSELLANEQIIASESVLRQHYEGFGEVRQAAPPAKFSITPSEVRGAAPKLGEHSDQILAQLGYSQEQRAGLFSKGIVKRA